MHIYSICIFILLCYIISYHIILYYIILYCIILYYIILYYIISYTIIYIHDIRMILHANNRTWRIQSPSKQQTIQPIFARFAKHSCGQLFSLAQLWSAQLRGPWRCSSSISPTASVTTPTASAALRVPGSAGVGSWPFCRRDAFGSPGSWLPCWSSWDRDVAGVSFTWFSPWKLKI